MQCSLGKMYFLASLAARATVLPPHAATVAQDKCLHTISKTLLPAASWAGARLGGG